MGESDGGKNDRRDKIQWSSIPTLRSGYLKNPKEQVPRVMLVWLAFFMIVSIFVTLAATAQESDR